MCPVVLGGFADEALTCVWKRVLASGHDDRVRAVLERFHRLLELAIAMPTVTDEQRNLVESQQEFGVRSFFIECCSHGLDTFDQLSRVERFGVDLCFGSLDGRFHAVTTVKLGPCRLRQCWECFVEPPPQRSTLFEHVLERLPVVLGGLERIPDPVVLHINGPCPLKQPVGIGRIAEFASNRLEDEERKRWFLRGVPIEEIQEHWFETLDV